MGRTRIKWRNVARAAALLIGIAAGCYFSIHSARSESIQTTAKTDFVSEHIQEEGFIAYEIPEEYAKNGGELDTAVQKRAWYACHGYKVYYPMVLAIIEVESGYRKDALSSAGAVGLMQIIPGWHRDKIGHYGDIWNPETNVVVGIRYLAELKEYCSDTNYLLMSYNMGLAEATRLWESGVHSTEYSRRIIGRTKEIGRTLKGAYL